MRNGSHRSVARPTAASLRRVLWQPPRAYSQVLRPSADCNCHSDGGARSRQTASGCWLWRRNISSGRRQTRLGDDWNRVKFGSRTAARAGSLQQPGRVCGSGSIRLRYPLAQPRTYAGSGGRHCENSTDCIGQRTDTDSRARL